MLQWNTRLFVVVALTIAVAAVMAIADYGEWLQFGW
jgi:hypothetical protein